MELLGIKKSSDSRYGDSYSKYIRFWNFVLQFGMKYPLPLVGLLSLLLGIALIFLSAFGVRCLSKERIASL